MFASPACNNGKQINLAAPFTTINGVPNQLAQSLISPVALKIASYLPAALNGCGQYLTVNLVSQYFWQMPARVDYQLTDKQTVFARYMATKQNQVLPYNLTPNNLLSASGNAIDDLATSAILGHTWLISSTKVNSFRLSLNRVDMLHDGSRFFGPTDVGINAFSYIPKALNLTITGGPAIGSGVGEDVYNHNTYLTANNDFTWIHGSHQIAFGADATHSLIDILANVRSIGNYADTGAQTGLGMADFFAGYLTGPSAIRESTPNDLLVAQWFFGAYAQDTWKVNQHFTVNYGLRWEPFFPLNSKDKRVYNFSLARVYADQVSAVWTNAAPGFTYPGDAGFQGNSGMNRHWGNFEPRVGIAWDPFGDGKSALRAGGGINYDFVNEELYHNEDNVAPFAGDTTIPGPISLANPWATSPAGDPFPYVSTPPIGRFTTGAVYLPINPNIKTTYRSHTTWNVSLQRQFTSNLFASASYVGNHAIHLWDNIELNPESAYSGRSDCGVDKPAVYADNSGGNLRHQSQRAPRAESDESGAGRRYLQSNSV